jgi:hypothetical protein
MIPARRLVTPCLAAFFVGAGASVWAEPAAPVSSPFLPPAGEAANGAQSPSSPYELTGMSTTSQGTQVCIFDAKAKHSHWIAIGGAYDDIRVVSYDPASDHAVIDVRGSRMTLDMRKAVVSHQPAFAAAPVPIVTNEAIITPRIVGQPVQAPVQAESPETAKQERDARMLVSDLMDIGMQQRKAVEEAKKKEQEAQEAAKQN